MSFSSGIWLKQAGPAGLSVVWKGQLASPPSSPNNLWAYYNTTNKVTYVYYNNQWNIMCESLGDEPAHEWNGTELRFQNPDSTWGEWVDLEGIQGPQGEQGIQGVKGDKPAHEWLDTTVRFENPDGSWGSYTDLEGPQGIQGIQGEKGDKPSHTWIGTSLQFENPDGSPGTSVELKGEQGDVSLVQLNAAVDPLDSRIEDLEDLEILYIGEAGAPAFLNGWANAVAGRELRLIKRGKTISLCGYIYQSSWIGNSVIFNIPSTLQSSYPRAFSCVGTLAGGLRSIEAVIYSSSVSYRNVTTNQYNSTGLPLNIELTWVLED